MGFDVTRFYNNNTDKYNVGMYYNRTTYLNIKWTDNKIEHCNDYNTLSKKCVIAIPVYKKTLCGVEKDSLQQVVNILGDKYELVLVCPIDFNIQEYKEKVNYDFSVLYCTSNYFASQKAYSNLCTTWQFYEAFKEYEYMVIYQLDAWIFEDKLDYFMNLNYDYMGAPHLVGIHNRFGENGNGGFCLRKIQKFIDVCKKTDFRNFGCLEDCIFTQKLGSNFNLAPIDICRQFSWQESPQLEFKYNGDKLPMGCHAFKKFGWGFWAQYIHLSNEPMPVIGQTKDNNLVHKQNDRLVSIVEKMYGDTIIKPKLLNKKNIVRKFR